MEVIKIETLQADFLEDNGLTSFCLVLFGTKMGMCGITTH